MYEYMCVYICIFDWVAVLTLQISQPVMTSTIFRNIRYKKKYLVSTTYLYY